MKKILCIEDDLYIADVIEMALGDIYHLEIVTNASHVMDKLSGFLPDLILIDNYIGLIQAAEVMQNIKGSEQYKDIPFILCSGHADIKQIAHDMSADAYLEKPFNLEALYAIIAGVFQKSNFGAKPITGAL